MAILSEPEKIFNIHKKNERSFCELFFISLHQNYLSVWKIFNKKYGHF